MAPKVFPLTWTMSGEELEQNERVTHCYCFQSKRQVSTVKPNLETELHKPNGAYSMPRYTDSLPGTQTFNLF